MENITQFIIDNYIWIMVACLILVLTLIGFIVDQSKKKKITFNESNGNSNTNNDIQIDSQNTTQTPIMSNMSNNDEPQQIETPIIDQPSFDIQNQSLNNNESLEVNNVAVQQQGEITEQPVQPLNNNIQQESINNNESLEINNVEVSQQEEITEQPVQPLNNLEQQTSEMTLDDLINNQANGTPNLYEPANTLNTQINSGANTEQSIPDFNVNQQSIEVNNTEPLSNDSELLKETVMPTKEDWEKPPIVENSEVITIDDEENNSSI